MSIFGRCEVVEDIRRMRRRRPDGPYDMSLPLLFPQDDVKYKKAVSLPAPEYILTLLEWTADIIAVSETDRDISDNYSLNLDRMSQFSP